MAIINTSLTSGVGPDHFKTACVQPLLKGPSLGPTDVKKLPANLKILLHIEIPGKDSAGATTPSSQQ